MNHNERYRYFFEHNVAAIYLWEFRKPMPLTLSLEETCSWVKKYCALADGNELVRDIYGFGSIKDARGKSFYEMIGKNDALHDKIVKQYRDKGYWVKDLEIEEVDQFGNTIWFLDSSTPVIKDNCLCTLYVTSLDITERKISELINDARLTILEYSASSSVSELLVKTIDEAEKITNSEIAFFHLVDEDQKSLSLQAWSSRTTATMCKVKDFSEHYNVDQAGVWVDCIHQKKPVIYNDYSSLSHKKGYPEGHTHVVRLLTVPVIRDKKIVAIIGVGNKTVNYTEKDAKRLSHLADLSLDIAERKIAEERVLKSESAWREIISRLSNKKGQEFFDELVSLLHRLSAADYTLIAELSEDSKQAQTLSLNVGGKKAENITYNLKGSPCDEVIKSNTCLYLQSVTSLYPDDCLLADLDIDSYVGTRIFDNNGKTAGIIVSLFKDPFSGDPFVTALFELCAAYAGSEMERSRSELILQQSETRYRSIFESSGDAILLVKEDRFIDCNQESLRQLKCRKEDLIGKTPMDISPEFQPDGKRSEIEARKKINAVLQGKPQFFEWEHTSFDNELLTTEIRLTPLDKESQIFIAIWRDITKRVKLEKAKRLDETRLEALLKLHEQRSISEKELYDYALEEAVRLTGSKVGYLHFFDKDEQTISLNAWSKETLKVCSAEKNPHYPLASAGIWADCLRQRSPVIHNEYQNCPYKKGYPEGHFTILRHMSVPIFDEDKIIAIIGVGNKEEPYDDTDSRQLTLFFSSTWSIIKEKKHEEEKKQLKSNLRQAQKMEAIGTLAGGIAHDFNNILGAILGYTDMALEEIPADSSVYSDIQKVFTAGERAKDLVKQILTFSRQADQELQPLKVQLVIKEDLKLLRSTITTAIEIKQDIDPNCQSVLADPTQIHQIVMNICTNAYHAMRETGGVLSITLKTIRLTSEKSETQINLLPGKYLKLTISDTGCGIPLENLERIFDPYFTTKAKGEGTGLGLAVVHGIVNSFGGDITVHSEPDKGTTFHIYLPVIEDTKQVLPEEEVAPLPTGNEQILLVDDDEGLVEMHKKMLKSLGYNVTALTSSISAIEKFQMNPVDFDLIISDMNMPKMTGADLARQILDIRPGVPIILCTGYSELINEEKAKTIGIRGFIMKPVIKKDLAEAVRKALDTIS